MNSIADDSGSGSEKSKLGLFLALGLVLVLGLVFRKEIPVYLDQALTWIEAQGVLGAVFFVLLYIVTTVVLVPGSILTLGAGAIYGVFWGTVVVSISSVLGATLAFLIGRHYAGDWVSRQIEKYPKFEAINSAISEGGKKIVFLIRLSPAFPFNFLNYAFGITKVSLPDYVVASWAGMLPGTVLYVYLGSLAGELARAGAAGGEGRSALEWTFLIVGFIATIAVTVYITKTAKASLDKETTRAQE